MPVFETTRKLTNGKKYGITANSNKSENSSSEANPIISAHESNTDNESEVRVSIQEEVY